MRVSSSALLFTLAIIVLIAGSLTEAHKSVRHIKPQSEEARAHHHAMEREQPPKEDGDEVFMVESLKDQYSPLDHSHKHSRHKKWGPEHPNHIKHKNWHYKAPRFFEGEEIDDEILDEDLHLFGISKYNELH